MGDNVSNMMRSAEATNIKIKLKKACAYTSIAPDDPHTNHEDHFMNKLKSPIIISKNVFVGGKITIDVVFVNHSKFSKRFSHSIYIY